VCERAGARSQRQVAQSCDYMTIDGGHTLVILQHSMLVILPGIERHGTMLKASLEPQLLYGGGNLRCLALWHVRMTFLLALPTYYSQFDHIMASKASRTRNTIQSSSLL
jgi:hypothetical protein